MIWSSHRPSDDPCLYNFHIPDNFMLGHTLEYILYFAQLWMNITLFNIAKKLQSEIYSGIHEYGTTADDGEVIYCYETDGLGNCNLMDDANLPSLLSLPAISHAFNHQIYENTRGFILSANNPYFFNGTDGTKGIGFSHTQNMSIWPLALITEAMTDKNIEKRYEILSMLMKNTANTNLMHESFNVLDDEIYTREWFAWANSYFRLFGNCLKQFMRFVSRRIKAKITKMSDLAHKVFGLISEFSNVNPHKRWEIVH